MTGAEDEASALLALMAECNEGRGIVSGSDGSVFVSRPTAIQFALELAKRKVAEERERCAKIAEDDAAHTRAAVAALIFRGSAGAEIRVAERIAASIRHAP